MIDARRAYAVVAGIIAAILVIWLAVAVLGAKEKGELTPVKPATEQQAPAKKSGLNQVQQTVSTPNMNMVKQSVTVRR